MEPNLTDDGRTILSSIEGKLGRSPSKDEIDTVYDVLESRDFTCLSQGGATARHVFVLPEKLLSGGGGVVKLPAKANDFFGNYELEHLGVDQNIRAVYTAEYLVGDDLAPPVIDYSTLGSWVVFPIVDDLDDAHMDEFREKADEIRERDDVRCATQQEVSETLDIDVPVNWGVYDGDVVLRDVGSVVVMEDAAPELDIEPDP